MIKRCTHFRFRWGNLFRSLERGRQRVIMEIIIGKFSPIFIFQDTKFHPPPPSNWMFERSFLSLIYKENSFHQPRVDPRLQFFPSCIFRLFHPFLSLLTLFPDHPLSSPWESTHPLFTRPPCSPILENPNEILKVREIWYSSPFTLPLFAAAMLATRLQTSRKTRVKLIETNGRFCFRLRFNWYY